MIDTGDLTTMSHALKRMLNGERLTSKQVAEEYGVSRSTFSVMLNTFAKRGLKFERTEVPDPDPHPRNNNGGVLMSATLAPDTDRGAVEEMIASARPERLSVRMARWFEQRPDEIVTMDMLAEEFPDEERRNIGSSAAALLNDKVRPEWQGKLDQGPVRGSYVWNAEQVRDPKERGREREPKFASNGNGAAPDLSKRGALVRVVADYCMAHPDTDLTPTSVAEALHIEREQARGAMEGMCSGHVRSDYRGLTRTAPGVFRWVGIEAAAKANYGRTNSRKGHGAETHGKNGAKANGVKTKRGAAVEHVPAGGQNGLRDPSSVASAMLGFDTHGAPPVPTLGSLVRVVGQMLDEESGDVKLMVKNAQGTWVTDVDGVSLKEGDEGG